MEMPTKPLIDAAAVGATVATIAGWIPPVLGALASLLTVIWMGMRIYVLGCEKFGWRRRCAETCPLINAKE